VVDNDNKQSAKNIVKEVNKKALVFISYFVEPEMNIALARNRAINEARGDYIVFIDDDEIPSDDWLVRLYTTCNEYAADAVFGPVKPHFEKEPPQWKVKAKIFCKPSINIKSGSVLHWDSTSTCNVLLVRKTFKDNENKFNPAFGRSGGEDVDFFRRASEKGSNFIWCAEALVYETIPPERFKKSYLLNRAFLEGANSYRHIEDTASFKEKTYCLMKTLAAILIYTVALPYLYLLGKHFFMKYLIKNCHHVGRFCKFGGITLVKERKF